MFTEDSSPVNKTALVKSTDSLSPSSSAALAGGAGIEAFFGQGVDDVGLAPLEPDCC